MSPHCWWTCFAHASEWVPQYDVRLGSCFSIYISRSTELGLTTPKRLYSKSSLTLKEWRFNSYSLINQLINYISSVTKTNFLKDITSL